MATTHPETFDVTQLDADQLEHLLVLALGLNPCYDGETMVACLENGAPMLMLGDPAASPFLHSFCREWSIGGPLIEQYGISLAHEDSLWLATWRGASAKGKTPLMAAMGVMVQHFDQTREVLHDFTNLTRLQVLQQLYRPAQSTLPTAGESRPVPPGQPSGAG